jgi:hypothetical protein
MFCPLYKLFDAVKVDFHEYEHCNEACPFRNHDTLQSGVCKVTEKRHDKLTSEKFGWMIETVIQFQKAEPSKNIKTLFSGFILLSHPSEKDLWAAKYFNKKSQSKYSIYNGERKYDFDDLKALNFWLKKQGYPGRDLIETDFDLKEKACI